MVASVLPGYFDIKPCEANNNDTLSFAMAPIDSPLMRSPVSPYLFFDPNFSMDPSQPLDPRQTSSKSSGKRPSVQERRPSQQVQYEFLNFSNPEQAKAVDARRTVRSHVTRQQHQKDQAAAAAAAARRAGKVATRYDRASISSPSLHVSTVSTPSWNMPDYGSSAPISPLALTVSEAGSSVTSGPSSPQTYGLAEASCGQLDLFQIYPVEWHSSIPAVIDHYLTELAPQNIELSGIAGHRTLHQVWLPFLLSDVTLCHSLMLLSAVHINTLHGTPASTIDCCALRGWVLGGITERCSDPVRKRSDELAATILNMAYFEHMFGNIGTYVLHMRGLRNMVEERGGLHTLGLNGLLERMILWLDSNVSHLNNFEHIFPSRLFPSSYGHPFPDPEGFGMRRPSLTQSLH